MFNLTDVTGNKVNAGDVFVNADRHTVTFGRVTGAKHDAKAGVTNVVTVNDTFDGDGALAFGDVHAFVVSDAETVSVVRA